jgi:raffinose/stachyose/melibiose transport system substrate-binding protein
MMSSGKTARRLRWGGAVIAGALAVGTMAGCSASSSDSGSGDPSGTLQVLVSSADASDKAFKDLNAAFMKKYPKVKVVFSSVPNNNFNASRSSRLTAGNLDVTLAQPREVPSYAKGVAASDDNAAADAGLFVDLSKESFMKNFTPSVLDSLKYNGKQYTVPTGLSYYTGVFYNKSIFDKYKLSVPTTWSDWQKLVSTLQSDGVTPLGIGGKDSWPAGLGMIAAVQGLYPTADDKQTLSKDLWSGDTKLTQGKQLEVLQRVDSLYGAAEKNFAGVGYDAIPSEFASGQVAMTIDGTWNQTTIDSAVNGAFDYGYFPLPASDNASDNKLLGGKVELRLAVASSAPNKTAAMAYLDFFSQPAQYKKFIATTGFAPAEPNIPASAFLTSIKDYTSTFSPAWDTVWVPNSNAGQAATFPFNYPGIAPLGTGTVAQAASDSQSAWEAGLTK